MASFSPIGGATVTSTGERQHVTVQQRLRKINISLHRCRGDGDGVALLIGYTAEQVGRAQEANKAIHHGDAPSFG